jgi:hypothetical protein
MRELSDRLRPLRIAALALTLLVTAPAVARAQFGIASFSTSSASSQAGAHADFSTSFALDTEALGNPIGQLENTTVQLPPGVIGDPQAIERCSDESFQDFDCAPNAQVGVLDASLIACRGVESHLQVEAEAGETAVTVSSAAGFCGAEPGNTITIGAGASEETARIAYDESPSTLVLSAPLKEHHAGGEAVTHLAEPTPVAIPLFNLQPSSGHVATLGASLLSATILIQVGVDNERGYGLTATIGGVSTLVTLQGVSLTLWGVPADPSHDAMRCNQLGFDCGLPSGAAPAPFMTNPTDCSGIPLESSLTVESWQGEAASSKSSLAAPSGCEKLSMSPTLSVAPDTTQLDAPAGYEVDLKVPPNEEPFGLATPDLQNVAVTLPPGTSLSPAVASGLQACAETQFEHGDCPNASKVGTAEVTSPLLPDHLTGEVYVGAPTSTEKYRLFVTVSADSVTVNLTGHVMPDEEPGGMASGQVTTVFDNAPQLPFSDFKLRLFGGPTAALANPATCGPATSTAQITSYGGQASSMSSVPFVVDENGEGGACPPSLPFTPSFSAGSTSPFAGAYSPFTLTVSRADGQQDLSAIDTQLPAGLVGILKSAPLCPEPQAGQGICPQAAEIGTATVGAGAGPLPFYVSGPVYLTGPYDGAPFGLSIVVNAIAGPFDLGSVVVRASIAVDPGDAHLTISSGRLPQILDGVPLRLRTIYLDVDRPGFMVNPTDCGSLMVTGRISSAQDAVETTSAPYHVAGCAGLAFAPRIAASTLARTSKTDGAYLRVKIASGAGQANIAKVKVDLPEQLPSRLSTLQKACTADVFDANPASCPTTSRVGVGTARTPVLANPLTGPAYLVSHGGAGFPDIVVVLQGEGITVDLVGNTHITKGITSSTFDSVPDVPIRSFELVLPEGPHSLLTANGNVCRKALKMPTSIVGHNGASIHLSTRIAASGCTKAKRTG